MGLLVILILDFLVRNESLRPFNVLSLCDRNTDLRSRQSDGVDLHPIHQSELHAQKWLQRGNLENCHNFAFAGIGLCPTHCSV